MGDKENLTLSKQNCFKQTCVEGFDEGADVGVHKAEGKGDFGITKIVQGVSLSFHSLYLSGDNPEL